jgi:hypothetical protein
MARNATTSPAQPHWLEDISTVEFLGSGKNFQVHLTYVAPMRKGGYDLRFYHHLGLEPPRHRPMGSGSHLSIRESEMLTVARKLMKARVLAWWYRFEQRHEFLAGVAMMAWLPFFTAYLLAGAAAELLTGLLKKYCTRTAGH